MFIYVMSYFIRMKQKYLEEWFKGKVQNDLGNYIKLFRERGIDPGCCLWGSFLKDRKGISYIILVRLQQNTDKNLLEHLIFKVSFVTFSISITKLKNSQGTFAILTKGG